MTLEKTTTEFTFGRLSDIKTVVKVHESLEYSAKLESITPVTSIEVITKDFVKTFRYSENNGKVFCIEDVDNK